MTFDIVSKTNCPKSEPPILLCERYQLDLFFTHQFLNASVLYGSCLDCGSIDKVGDLWMSMRKWPSEEFCPWWSQLPSRITRYASDHHSIKCLISVLGRALFFYQDFHFDFLLQYSLSYCWEDRPVSKEKPRSIRCFFFIFVFFLTFGGWNFNHIAQKILIKRAFLRIFFFWDQLNFSLSGVFKRRAI